MALKRGRGRPPHDDVLTPTEWRIVHAAQHGMTNREIAERRGVSVDAVKFHLDNVRAKLQIDSKKSLRQWFRSPAGSALKRQAKASNRGVSMKQPMALGSLGQISRSVRNIVEAEKFYGTVLGLPHLYTFGTLAFFDCAGTRLFLSENEQPSSQESLLYFSVEDIAVAHDELRARGVEFIAAPHLIHKHTDGTEEWMAFFKDPEGRSLAIMSQVKAS